MVMGSGSSNDELGTGYPLAGGFCRCLLSDFKIGLRVGSWSSRVYVGEPRRRHRTATRCERPNVVLEVNVRDGSTRRARCLARPREEGQRTRPVARIHSLI
jgi:hypothetical protein